MMSKENEKMLLEEHLNSIFVTYKGHGQPKNWNSSNAERKTCTASSRQKRDDRQAAKTNSKWAELSRLMKDNMKKLLTPRAEKKYVKSLLQPKKRKGSLSSLLKKNFVSPAPNSAKQDNLAQLMSQYEKNKRHLELHCLQLRLLTSGHTTEILYLPDMEEEKKIHYVREQIIFLKQMKTALSTDITAMREAMRQGDGCYQHPGELQAKMDSEVLWWGEISRLNQEQIWTTTDLEGIEPEQCQGYYVMM